MRKRLILFDIDGTLIADGGASRDAFSEALRTTYGYRGDAGRFDFSGRTDPQIAFMVLREDGFDDETIEKGLPDLWRAYLAGLEQNATPGRVLPLPGIEALLRALAPLPHLTIGLLTGNIEPGARLKLGPPALNDYFGFGAFGSDSADREKLPPIAVERASRIDGHRFEGQDVVLIGDSIYDVRCGVPYGATTIAVASGKTSPERLKAENPTHFFESAEDLEAMLAVLGG